MPNRSNPRVGLTTAAGVVFALLLSEISLRPWAGQLYRFDVQPLAADRIQAPTKTVRYYGQGIATSHFSPSRARLTGRAPVPGAPWIVIMGDSFVEGLQINDSETMGAVVERLAPVSAPINVRQYGWPGASPPKYVMEGPYVLQLWNPTMVTVIANANGFRTAALDTHWTTAQIRGDNFVIQPVSPNRLTVPVRAWFAMRHSALFEILTSRFVLDISPEIPGVHTFHSTAEAAQRTPSDAEVLPMMVRLLKETYGDRLFLVYAAEPSLTSTQPEPEETETLLQCRMQGVRCASTGPFLRNALLSLQYFGSGFSNSAPEKGHYNARGHRLVGELIWSEYRSRIRGSCALAVSLASNLGLLAYFKYANFFLSNFALWFGRDFKPLDIVLPIGISFYTFKTLSYTIDVYRRELPARRDWWKYAMFVTYFPQLIAGPIVRASVFLPQMTRSLRPSGKRAVVGLELILLGVTKKLLIADRMAVLADAVFEHPHIFSPLTVASGVVAYSLQIYCDFSGYSDIAIGVSRIVGFDLPENFNMPYLSTSITEFWRRWHMTLSKWLRDYLYIPLGGNRRGRFRTYFNLLMTMLLGGLWHGANWTFVIWGGLHGLALAGHKLWIETSKDRYKMPRFLSWAATYAFVCFGWIFFRSPNFTTAAVILRKLALLDRTGIGYLYLPLLLAIPLVVGAHCLGQYVGDLAAASEGIKYIRPPHWAMSLYRNCGERLALKPHPQLGITSFYPFRGSSAVLSSPSGFWCCICFHQ